MRSMQREWSRLRRCMRTGWARARKTENKYQSRKVLFRALFNKYKKSCRLLILSTNKMSVKSQKSKKQAFPSGKNCQTSKQKKLIQQPLSINRCRAILEAADVLKTVHLQNILNLRSQEKLKLMKTLQLHDFISMTLTDKSQTQDFLSIFFCIFSYIIYRTMAFIARENRQANNPNQSRAFGKGLFSNQDTDKLQKKNQAQKLYKEELERQMRQKQERKNREKELIKREDEKFQREIDQLNKKQQGQKNQGERKSLEKNQPSGFNPVYDPPPPKNQIHKNGNFQVNINPINTKTDKVITNIPQEVPNLNFKSLPDYQYQQNYYQMNESDPTHEYYEQRIKRHKLDLDRKLDELFHHIHSTQDNVKVDEEIEKIRMKLRGRSVFDREGLRDMTDSGMLNKDDNHIEEYSKFYRVPKKQSYDSSPKQSKVRRLDYQSTSAFKPQMENNYASRAKLNTGADEYSGNTKYSSQSRYRSKWGKKPNQDKFLSDRDAFDFEINKVLNNIDEFQQRLIEKI